MKPKTNPSIRVGSNYQATIPNLTSNTISKNKNLGEYHNTNNSSEKNELKKFQINYQQDESEKNDEDKPVKKQRIN